MKIPAIVLPALGGLLVLGSIGGAPVAAQAQTSSLAAAAAAIVGALLYDGSNHPYYVENNRRYYVSQPVATYYRGHHRGYVRQAYVPEQEYPVARPYPGNNGNHYGQMQHGNPGHNGPNHGNPGNNGQGNH